MGIKGLHCKALGDLIGGKRAGGYPAAGVRASAEIAATAKYEIKKTVIDKVPEDVVRAKSNAWLTMLSPFTQWAGLIGDKLAHKRELLRVQQEETLNAILRHAGPRLARLKSPILPIPLKFLVPFLENASLEEPDSELVRMWANLLVSSAESYNSNNVYYVRIISQLSSIQARIFEDVIGLRGARSVLLTMEEKYFLGNHFILEYIAEAFKSAKRTPRTLGSAWNTVIKALNMQGVVIEHIDIGHLQRDDYYGGPPPYSIYDDDNQNDYAILRGLGLLEYVDTGYCEIMQTWKIKVMAHYVSPLGLSFAQACGVGAAGSAKSTNRPSGTAR